MKTNHTTAPWKYKMFNNPNIKYSCLINSNNGDAVCKMLRDDAADNNIQEANAKLIAAAPELLETLNMLMEIIKTDHNLNKINQRGKAWGNELAIIERVIKKATE